ncbi:MAG: hypothetical protein LBR49_03290, partial [Tannerella sp.]|nr:hypothetical protein [Tannerella sp.]
MTDLLDFAEKRNVRLRRPKGDVGAYVCHRLNCDFNMIFMIDMIKILSGNNDTVAMRHKAESLTAISAGQRPVSANRTRPLRPDGAHTLHSRGMERSVERQ